MSDMLSFTTTTTPASGSGNFYTPLPSKKVLILGCGAIGSNLAANILTDRTPVELEIVDFDKIETRNVQAGTQLFLREQVGQFKADALQYNLYKWFGKRVVAHKIRFGPQDYSWLNRFNLIIDCFDNYESRKAIFDYPQDVDHQVLHIGFSHLMTFEICWNHLYKVPSDTRRGAVDICDMEGARSFIQYVAGLAGMVVNYFLRRGFTRSFIGNTYSIIEVK